MAAAFVKSTGLTSTDSASTTTYVFGSAPAATTNTVIVKVTTTNASLANGAFTDNQSGTYVIDHSASDGNVIKAYVARRTNALSTGSTITVTVTGSSGDFWSGCADEYSGVSTSTVLTGSSGSGTSSPFTASLGSALNSGDLAISVAEADDNTANQGISDPPTGGTATWTTRAAQQGTNAHASIVAADLISAGGTESAITSCNTADSRIGIIVGYKSAGGGGGSTQQQQMLLGVGS